LTMTSKPYTKREMDVFLKNIDDKTSQILEQVKLTNGRVSSLEIWKATMIGAIALLTFLVSGIIIPIAIKWWFS